MEGHRRRDVGVSEVPGDERLAMGGVQRIVPRARRDREHRIMAIWTFMTLVGNGKRDYVEQVKASDFRSAFRAWPRTVVFDGTTDEARQRMASYEPRED